VGAAAAAIAACGAEPAAQRTGEQPSATPTRAPATAAPAPFSEWQKRGATEVPPDGLQAVSLEGIQVVNQTKGAIGDDDARAWASAYLRATGYEYWAVSHRQDDFLLRSGLSSVPLQVFRPDLADIDASKRANTRVEYTPKTLRRMVLRSVPQALQPTFAGQLVAWKPYAFYLDAVGPAEKRVTDANGKQTVQTVLPAGQPGFELVGGELVHDPLMGDVFAFASDWDCLAPSSRQKLAPLCNP
jgi:hypothetical protein